MAITIIKEPFDFYPAFNNSFLEFRTDLSEATKAEITAYPIELFPLVFRVFRGSDGVFYFNLKEIVKFAFLNKGFEDSEILAKNGYSIPDLFLEQKIDITMLSESGGEIVSKSYLFTRAVEQQQNNIHNGQVLAPPNGFDFNLSYWRGFPFSIDLKYLTSGNQIYILNRNTGVKSPILKAEETGAFRLNIDQGNGDNWISNNFLHLTDNINKLELYVNNSFKANINLFKKEQEKGVLLKWLNEQGSYSYHLFSCVFEKQTQGKELYITPTFNTENAGGETSNFRGIGKEVDRQLKLKTKYTTEEGVILDSLFSSPLVQVYNSNEKNIRGWFTNVFIKENFTRLISKEVNELTITAYFGGQNSIK